MILSELVSNYIETHPNNNPRCDSENCNCKNSIVRIIPIDNSLNVNLCSCCYEIELGISIDRELEGKEPVLPTFIPFSFYPVFFGEL